MDVQMLIKTEREKETPQEGTRDQHLYDSYHQHLKNHSEADTLNLANTGFSLGPTGLSPHPYPPGPNCLVNCYEIPVQF